MLTPQDIYIYTHTHPPVCLYVLLIMYLHVFILIRTYTDFGMHESNNLKNHLLDQSDHQSDPTRQSGMHSSVIQLFSVQVI